MKTISVHIVTYNSEAHIEHCLESVFAQSFPIRQIIVVDNASVDGTLAILEKFKDRIILIQNSENIGFAAAHNQAIRLSASDYFLVLNPDVILHRDYLRNLHDFLLDKEKAGSFTGKLLTSDGKKIDSTGLVITKSRRAFDRGAQDEPAKWEKPAKVFGVSGAAALYCRKMAKEISLDGQFFDEMFFAYKEDVDVAWRAQLMGWDAYYVPSALARHERGWKIGKRKLQPLKIRQHSYINRYYMIFKNDSLSYLLRHLVHIISFEILSFLYILFKEPRLLFTWVKFFRNLSVLLKKRKLIQARRKRDFEEIYKYFIN